VSKPSLPELILGTIAETLAAHWPAVGRAIRIGVGDATRTMPNLYELDQLDLDFLLDWIDQQRT
jgi:hypothetical protein